MNFIRPELMQAIIRWRETLAGLAALLLGLLWVLTQYGALFMLGIVLVIGGGLLAFAGVQRARFRLGSGGPGVVQIVEGQLTYFGPLQGGAMPIEALALLELEPAPRGSAQWILTTGESEPLAIPVNAEGAEALFDVFASLPGLSTERMLSNLKDRPTSRVVVWQKHTKALH